MSGVHSTEALISDGRGSPHKEHPKHRGAHVGASKPYIALRKCAHREGTCTGLALQAHRWFTRSCLMEFTVTVLMAAIMQ